MLALKPAHDVYRQRARDAKRGSWTNRLLRMTPKQQTAFKAKRNEQCKSYQAAKKAAQVASYTPSRTSDALDAVLNEVAADRAQRVTARKRKSHDLAAFAPTVACPPTGQACDLIT